MATAEEIRNNLRSQRLAILKDVQFKDVEDYLTQANALTDTDIDQITGRNTERDKMKCLLDCLERRPPSSYTAFCKALEICAPHILRLLEPNFDPQENSHQSPDEPPCSFEAQIGNPATIISNAKDGIRDQFKSIAEVNRKKLAHCEHLLRTADEAMKGEMDAYIKDEINRRRCELDQEIASNENLERVILAKFDKLGEKHSNTSTRRSQVASFGQNLDELLDEVKSYKGNLSRSRFCVGREKPDWREIIGYIMKEDEKYEYTEIGVLPQTQQAEANGETETESVDGHDPSPPITTETSISRSSTMEKYAVATAPAPALCMLTYAGCFRL